jgi:hypothetical protein
LKHHGLPAYYQRDAASQNTNPPAGHELCLGNSATGVGESRIPVRETIQFGDIPQTILNEVLECLRPFSAPITVIERQRDLFPGSCTFVEFEGRHYLLTAAHVWEGLKPFGHIGITVRRTASPPVRICTQDLRPIVVGKRENDVWNEWGPDLAFLELSDSDAENLMTYKSFCNLGNRHELKSVPLQEIGNAAWVIVGFPEEQIKQIGNNFVFEMRAGFCPAVRLHIHSQFDYVDLGINTRISSALGTHVGMSGSGLWRVRIIRNQAGHLTWLPKELSLEGVAFWQEPIVDGHRIIRCHGRKSLYGEGLAAIGAFTQ